MNRILCFLAMRHFLALAALLAALVAPGSAQACLFARDAQPKDWLDWATVLVAADVTGITQDKAKDIVQLSVRETFKGPPMAQSATLEVPSRLWTSCRLERPAIGARVLVAINPNSDALLLPLAESYAELLRRVISPEGTSAPAPTTR